MLAKELAELEYRVIVTTTTHMIKPKDNFQELGSEINVGQGNILTVGISCENGKIKGMKEHAYARLLEYADFVLIEADGSKRMPLKVPAEHEPALIEETDFVVGVLGFRSVGKKICEVSHRQKDVAEFLGKQTDEIVTVQDLERISFSKNGLIKSVKTPYQIISNQWKKEEISLEKNMRYCCVSGKKYVKITM